MVDALLRESFTVILVIVQSNYSSHIQVLEDVHIAGSCMAVSVNCISLINWTHEGHELAWNNPVEVSVLNFLVVLVLLGVESLEVIPAAAYAFLESFKAVKDCAFVEAVSLAGISE